MADRPEMRNEVVGTSAGAVVQAGTLHGDVHVHAAQDPVVPRQLPSRSGLFAGRVDELTALDTQLGRAPSGSTMLISAVGGAGGIGKTWLVLQWAHRQLENFPDGQLFVDLRGFSPDSEPMAPAVAVRVFLDALGVDPARMPVDLTAQAALFRSLVARKRILIVLDNAADAGQVVPLLPGGDSCTVVVTSRRALTGLITRHGAHHLRLDTLTAVEARLLLVRRLGADRIAAEPAAVTELVELCGGFPLALGIIAGRALVHRHVPLTELAAELRDLGLAALVDDDPSAGLPTVLSWSFAALTARQRTLFVLLGIAPGPDIGLPAATNLAGLAVAETVKVLRELEEASLVLRNARGRYSMHDLIRHYAADTAHEQLTSGEREAALRRVIDFYLHTAYAGDRVLAPNRTAQQLDPPERGCTPEPVPDGKTALAWFDVEHPCLLAVLRTAVDQNRHRTTWLLAWSLSIFHTRRGHERDNHATWQKATIAAEHLDDPQFLLVALRFLGAGCSTLGRHDEAITHLRRCLELAERQNDKANIGGIHRAIAWTAGRQGRHEQAAAHTVEAVTLFREIGHGLWEAWALNDLGWYTAQLGEFDQARGHCQAALALFGRHHDADGESVTWDSLGYIEHHRGNHQDAVGHYRRALAMCRDLGATSQLADTLDGLGHPLAALGSDDEARATWQEALGMYLDQGNAEAAARVRRQLDAL
ncbi:ATP-binding protein [Lentzea sp. NPDC059081]|uniref:ATP-binding protein n=1 Tax=Lentzea sp. NPDC059081 TaxID=3346719 RepID=UPI0036C8B638